MCHLPRYYDMQIVKEDLEMINKWAEDKFYISCRDILDRITDFKEQENVIIYDDETFEMIKLRIQRYCDGMWHTAVVGGCEFTYERCSEDIKSKADEVVKNNFNDDEIKTFDNFEGHEKEKQEVKNFLADMYRTLILHGKTGTGKTHLSKALMREAIERGMVAKFITSVELADLFRKKEGGSKEDRLRAQDLYNQLAHSDLLIIDDLGSERETNQELFEEQFKMLIDKHKGKIVVSTNLKLSDRYNDKIVSRLTESSKAITMKWKDYRITKNGNKNDK